MRWRPFDSPLSELTSADLDRLVEEEVEESLFLEYKSEWSARATAKTIAAFANTEGGTLVLGIKTEDRRPVEVVGIEHSGDLGESLDRVVRSHVPPVLDVRFAEIRRNVGLPALIIEVPVGPSKPYLLTQTGQIVRRTNTASEPANREFLDRLLLEGQAGERWARERADALVAEGFDIAVFAPKAATLWTIPTMEGGLSVASKLFRHESWVKLLGLVSSSRMVRPYSQNDADQDVSDRHLEARIPGVRGNEVFTLRADTTGTMTSSWSEPNGAPDALKTLISESLPLHKEFSAEILGHSGSVVIAGRNAWAEDLGEGASKSEALSIFHPDLVQVDCLDDPKLEESLHRAVDRSRGWWNPEP